MPDEAYPSIEPDGIEAEILREKVATYVRISRTLEMLVARLDELDEELSHLGAAEGRKSIDEFNACRERAMEYFWYLKVQREALGFRRHDGLEELYPIPPRRSAPTTDGPADDEPGREGHA